VKFTLKVLNNIFSFSIKKNKVWKRMKSIKPTFYKISFVHRCCNTCEDVWEAYRRKKWAPPDPAEVKQCQNDKSMDKLKHAFTQGCQIYGYMEVNRVGGSFHIAPGASFSVNHVHGELIKFKFF